MKTQIVNRWRTTTRPSDVLVALETTEDMVWISPTTECQRYTIRGVPAKRIDVLVQHTDAPLGYMVEVSDKPGRYDGAIRRRITLRRYERSMATIVQPELTQLTITGYAQAVVCIATDDRQLWCENFDRLRWELDPKGGLERIVGWHLARWYAFLLEEGVRAADVAGEIEASQGPMVCTLSEANRIVSRYLYRLARDLGWRKLTARERSKLGIEGDRQWWKEEEVNRITYRQTGCGDETHRAAAGMAYVEDWE